MARAHGLRCPEPLRALGLRVAICETYRLTACFSSVTSLLPRWLPTPPTLRILGTPRGALRTNELRQAQAKATRSEHLQLDGVRQQILSPRCDESEINPRPSVVASQMKGRPGGTPRR